MTVHAASRLLQVVGMLALLIGSTLGAVSLYLVAVGLYGLLTNQSDGHASHLSLAVCGLVTGAFALLLVIVRRKLSRPNPSFQRTAAPPPN